MAFEQDALYCERCRTEVEGEGGRVNFPGRLKKGGHRETSAEQGNTKQTPSATCCDPCRKIERITAQIKQAEAHLSEHTAWYEAHIATLTHLLSTAQTSHNSLHDPLVQLLPPEIMSYIFYQSCLLSASPSPPVALPETPDFDPGQPRPRRSRPQCLVLGEVCRSWRALAWNTPELWTDVSVHFGNGWSAEREFEFMEDWFARSGRLPVSLRLTATPNPAADPWATVSVSEQRKNAVEAINTRHSRRIRLLDLAIPNADFWDIVSEMQVGPGLDELSIHSDVRTGAGMMPRLLRASSQARLPAPRVIRVTCVPPLDINISWKNMTHIELQLVEDSMCFAVLQQATNVVSCKFLQVLPDSAPPLPPAAASVPASTPTVLPHLRHLQYSNPNRPRAFAWGFSLPALEELVFNVKHAKLPATSLVALIMRSDAPLRLLDLAGWCDDQEEGLLELLRVLPSLEELRLCPSPLNPRGVSEGFFRAFITEHLSAIDNMQQKDRNMFLPNLKSLEYQGRVTFPWRALTWLVPGSPQTQVPPADVDASSAHRPLHTVRLELGMHRTNFIDKDVVLDLLEAQRRFGMVWSVSPASPSSEHGMFMNAGDLLPIDLLLASMEHHRIPLEREEPVGR